MYSPAWAVAINSFAQVGIAKTSASNTVAFTPSKKDNLFSDVIPHKPTPDLPAFYNPSVYQTRLWTKGS
jgi:hypothetical protein